MEGDPLDANNEKENENEPSSAKNRRGNRLSVINYQHHTKIQRAGRMINLVTKATSSKAAKRNISQIREKVKSRKIIPEVYAYSQKISDNFLEEWLDFPTKSNFTYFNNLVLPMRWLVWTSKNLLGLDPADSSLRDRIASSVNVLGTVAGLFLVIAVAALLAPPGLNQATPPDQLVLDLYGIFMFISGATYIGYIAYILTVFHPILQSLREDVLFDAYERYMRRWGGYDLYLFNIGLHFMIFGLITGSYILYSMWAIYVIVALAIIIYGSTIFFSRECFLSLDPISAMHLGLSNEQQDRHQAEKLSAYLLHKLPNTILHPHESSDDTINSLEAEAGLFTKKEKEERKDQEKERFSNERPNSASRISSSLLKKTPESKSPVLSRKGVTSIVTSTFSKLGSKISPVQAETDLSLSEHNDLPQNELSIILPQVSLPSDLYELFSQEKYLVSKLPIRECEEIYQKLYGKGVTATDQFINYMNDMKQCLPSCQCERFHQYLSSMKTETSKKEKSNKSLRYLPSDKRRKIQNVPDDGDASGSDAEHDDYQSAEVEGNELWDDYSGLHHSFCANRLSSCWLRAFERLIGENVSIQVANEAINFFKPLLR